MRLHIWLLLVLVFGFGLIAGHAIPGRDGGSAAPGAGAAALPAVNPASGAAVEALQAAAPSEHALPEGLTEIERRNIEIFRSASRSAVYITRVALRRDFFSFDVTRYQQGTGSGFIWDDEGHVVTNFHVVQTNDRSTEYLVTLWDQSEWPARIVGVARGKDLAVLRIDAPRELLQPVSLGSSERLAVGQQVLAVGNPFGLDQTLTVGVVSALGRDLQAPDGRTIHDVVQTDAAINPGNSGGPLLDSRGRLIGVNTAIQSPSGASAGIGFAIPVDTVSRLVPQMIQYGEPIRTGIGISVLTDYQARRYGFEGIVVTEVVPGMPADRAGIEPVKITRRGEVSGDVIVAVDDKRVRSLPELQDAFEEAGGLGATVKLTLLNGNRRREVQVPLVEINR